MKSMRVSVILIFFIFVFPLVVTVNAAVLVKPTKPILQCGNYNYNNNTYPISVSWSGQSGINNYHLQVYDASGKWYYNDWIKKTGKLTEYIITNTPPNKIVYARYRSTVNYSSVSAWSDRSDTICISSLTPTPTPSRSPTSTPTPTPLPDLEVDSVTFDQNQGYPVITIKNSGPGAANTSGNSYFTVAYHWLNAVDTIVDNNRAQAITVSTRINPGQTYAVNRAGVNHDWTWERPDDAVKVRITADYGNSVRETNKNNNTKVVTLEKLPDFKVDWVRFDTQGGKGSYSVSNIGGNYKIHDGTLGTQLKWLDSAGNEVGHRAGDELININAFMLSEDWFMEFGRPPPGAVRYEATVNLDDIFQGHPIKENDSSKANNKLTGAVPAYPTLTPTPTPRSTLTPTPPGNPDLTIESVTIDPATGRAVMTVKNIGVGNFASIVEVVSPDYNINWKNSAGTVVGSKYGMIVTPMFDSEPDPNIVHIQIYDPIPQDAIAFDATVNDMWYVSESNFNNNRLSGPLLRNLTITPTPIASAAAIVSPSPASSEKQELKKGLKYPIAELGNCKNEKDCRIYCDKPENIKACVSFGANKGLMTHQEVTTAQNVTNTTNGPGGCNNQASCVSYCDKSENISACLDYAQKNNLMNAEELEKARKVASVIASGGNTPGNCANPKTCKAYCSNDFHITECVHFAQAAGLISAEEAARANQYGDRLKNGGPGGCRSREQCEAYCSDQSHGDECRRFFPENEGQPSGQPRGNGGPVCTTRDECIKYCQDPSHAEACKNVVIKQDENSGPTQTGDIGQLKANILQMPQEAQDCIKRAIGEESFNKIMNGQPPEKPLSGDVMEPCFAQGVKEYELKNMPTKKPDDFDFGSPPPNQKSPPVESPAVKGVSTSRFLFDIILHWITGK